MSKKFQLPMIVLDRALTTKRPHKAESTAKFCEWLCKLLPKHHFRDAIGNIHVDLRSGLSKSLFVAHVDTVHRTGGKNKVIKTDKKWTANGAPLGADDGVGVALLAHMIDCQVPGYYIFTQGEECGGIGATWLADNMAGLLMQFDRAIAFDRRATYSVISHQGAGRCCSDAFAEALSAALCDRDMLFMPDDTGVYTDTAEFTHLIPECTNISAGYDMEHSDRESLDMDHFRALCKAVPKIDWEALPVARDPKLVEPYKISDRWSMTTKWSDDDKADFNWSDLANLDYRTADQDLDLVMALEDAFDGKLNALVKLISEHASPASPRSAEKQIDRRRITEAFLCELLADARTVDTDTLLMMAFDQVGTGAWV